MQRPRRWIVVAVALPLLALAGYGAGSMGIADTAVSAASREFTTWQLRRPAPGFDDWVRARDAVERAIAISPGNPAAPELLGLLFLMRNDRPELAETALRHFARALELRPTSAYTWANVAEARSRLGHPRRDIEDAMLTAWRLGPSEPEVQRVVVDLGLGMWSEVDPSVQAIIREALSNAMRRNPYRTLPIVYRRGKLDFACPFVADDKRLARTVWPRRCKLEAD